MSKTITGIYDSREKVINVMDDLLATGGTIEACCQLVERNGAEVAGCAFLIELSELGGAQRIAPRDVFRLISY